MQLRWFLVPLAALPLLLLANDVPAYKFSPAGTVNGELRTWHKITVGFQGPNTSELANPNPFTDYRLEVRFTHEASGIFYVAAGYYAADGNAANSGASSGAVWLVHFCPNKRGQWNYTASFITGTNVAQTGAGGMSAGFMDGTTGSFEIGATDKVGRDLRGKGRLQYVGEHHLQFAETKEFFLKAGADSPENLLAYEDFDNTPNNGGFRKSWEPHIRDYRLGDPTWSNGKGKGLVGAITYLSSMGMNAFSFLTMNINGDDRNVFPYVSEQDFMRIDVSKTAQWEVVFEHADHVGMYLHFKTQETENDQLLDVGELGLKRKLYYRELIARFGHHLALNWNLGEENTNNPVQLRSFSEFFRETDPYNHAIVVHTFPNKKEETYRPLVVDGTLDGASLQSHPRDVFNDTLTWVRESSNFGHKWVVANDEQNPPGSGVRPDSSPNHNRIRKDCLWDNIMAGGKNLDYCSESDIATLVGIDYCSVESLTPSVPQLPGSGVTYYFGYSFDNSDLTCQDFRSRETMWNLSRYALEFFSRNEVPFWSMKNANELTSGRNRGLATVDSMIVVIYSKRGSPTLIDLSNITGRFYSADWYDPRNGGDLIPSNQSFQSGSVFAIPRPAGDDLDDWVLLLQIENYSDPTPSTVAVPTTVPTPFLPAKKPVPPEGSSKDSKLFNEFDIGRGELYRGRRLKRKKDSR